MEVEEWLDNNTLSIDIWRKKYQFEDETLEAWFDRVSGGDPDIRRLIVEKKFLFGGRVLANRGINSTRKISLSNCFIPGTKIITMRGVINIEDIQIGDYVITHDNTWQKVNNVTCREYIGDLFKIDVMYGFAPVICTPNHKFLTMDGWVRADRLFAGRNLIKLPSVDKFPIQEFTIKLSDFIEQNDTFKVYDCGNGMVKCGTKFKGGNNSHPTKYGSIIKNEIVINEDVQYLLGRWIGDGSTTRIRGRKQNSIFQIVFNAINERDSFNKCIKILESNFNINPSIRHNEQQNTLILRVDNVLLAEFIAKYVGNNCSTKRIPQELIGSLDVILGILDSDGSVHKDGKICLVMKNKELLYDVQESLMLNGINIKAPIKIKQSLSNVSRTYYAYKIYITQVFVRNKLINLVNKIYSDTRIQDIKNKQNINGLNTKILDGDIYSNITSVDVLENQHTDVYNISVENVHSYTVNGIVCHNCYVLEPPSDNIESIYDTAKYMARTFSYSGGVGISLDNIAPKGAKVNNAAKSSSGVVSFCDLYNTTGIVIGAEGRRSALMLSLSSEHPDIEEFIDAKTDPNKLTKCNMSVTASDIFMDAVYKNYPTHKVSFTRDTGECIEKIINPNQTFNKLVYNNWCTGEPGLVYMDRIRNWTMLSNHPEFAFKGLNPCGT